MFYNNREMSIYTCVHEFYHNAIYITCFWFGLMLNIPVNNFSVMLGRTHRFLGLHVLNLIGGHQHFVNLSCKLTTNTLRVTLQASSVCFYSLIYRKFLHRPNQELSLTCHAQFFSFFCIIATFWTRIGCPFCILEAFPFYMIITETHLTA